MTNIRRLLVALLLVASASLCQRVEPLVTVPFVGCAADGQQGPIAAPAGRPKRVALPANLANKLAWYSTARDAVGIGVLAPRGWHCFGTYGSSGASLYVAPEPLDSDKVLMHKNWHGFSGLAVQRSLSDGGTSGRFKVAQVIARVFPAHRDFVRSVVAEKLQPESDFPFGPYPSDKLHYLNRELVDFTTPANADGLGTASWLIRNADPIRGFAALFPDDDMTLQQLDMRLGPGNQGIESALINAMEQEILSQRGS